MLKVAKKVANLFAKPYVTGCGDFKLFFLSQIEIIAISVGVMPLMRAACPKEAGRTAANFCLVSERNPAILK